MQATETTQNLTPIAFSSLLKKYTLAEFFELPEPQNRYYYELIEGQLFLMPPPRQPHGELVARMNRSLIAHQIKTNDFGIVYHPREAIYVEDVWGTYVEPDMMYVSNALREAMGERRTSADVVFEFLSESTANYDKTTKADTYLALGVKELWLIDLASKTVEVRNADSENGFLIWRGKLYKSGENAESKVLSDWKINLDELFANL
ncbi:MAG: Uma2 family endonuclease [Pyrinomonadaceae bacterium]|nr:Uma2 family endonuclease [Pyrinomonadaceae bacterium]